MQTANHTLDKDVRYPRIPPGTNTFVNLGLNQRAAFFGCHEENVPLVVYLPNPPFAFWSNTSKLQLEYRDRDSQRDELTVNGAEVARQGNETGWEQCLACAVVYSTGRRENMTSQYEGCFQKHC